MAQDRRKALDDKTRKLGGAKIEEGKEHAAYQETQQQLLAIQAEQQQNLAVARAESKASFENNQTLAQAAELGAISAAEAEQMAQAGGQVTLNPATQSVLSKYGVGQPKFSRTQSHSQQVTKQNITINNNVTSNTTNDVKVPAGVGGPLQGRPLQFKDPQVAGQSSVNKFKVWISQAFARQNEEGVKRDREYRNRENSLTKSASRMMKKLEDVGKTIGTRMDPRKIGSTWQSQLKTLLLLFGFGYLTSNWTKVLDTVAGIEKWVKETWGYFTGNNEDGKSFVSDIKSFFGGNDNESFLQVFGKLLGKEGLFGYIKEYFDKLYQDRAQAVKEVKFPTIDTNSIFNTLASLGEYLGDLFGAIVGGTESVKKTVAKQAEKQAFSNSMKNYMDRGRTATTQTTTIGEFKGDKGALSLIDGSYKGLTAYSVDKEGNLDKSNLTEATLAASSEATRVKALIDKGDTSQTASLVQQLNRLYNTARETKNNYVAVTKEFIDSLSKDELQDLISRKLIQKAKYRIIYHKKTKEDLDRRENLDPTSRAADMYATQTAAYKLGGRLGSAATENYTSAIFGDWGAPLASITEYGLTSLERYLANDGRFTLARVGEKLKPGEQDTGETRDLYEISPVGIKMITNRLSNRNLEDEVDMENKAALQEALTKKTVEEQVAMANKAEKNVRKKLEEVNNNPLDVQANSMRPYQLENDLEKLDRARELIYSNAQEGYVNANNAINNLTQGKERIDAKFEQNTEGNRAVTVARNIKNKVNQATDYVQDKIYDYSGGAFGTPKLTVSQKDRATYAVNRLMKEGLNKEQASGIVGNMIKESSLNPNVKVRDNNGKFAGGIVGWNGPNLDAAENYFGRDIRNVRFEDQLEYLIKELKGETGAIRAVERHGFLRKHGFKQGANIMDVMKTTTSLQDSVDTFERVFEGSGDYAGWWTNKGKPNAKFHEGDRNKKRFEFATSVYNNSGGDLSKISYVPYNSTPVTSTNQQNNQKEQPAEQKSFLQILRDKVTEFITSFGGILDTADDKLEQAYSSISKKAVDQTDDKFNEKITSEFTNFNEYLQHQDSLPNGLPPGMTYEAWRLKVQNLTGSTSDKLQLNPDSNKILSKYIEKPNLPEIPIPKEKEAAVSQTTSAKDIAQEPIKIASNKDNDLLSIFDPKSTQSYTMTFRDISDGIDEMNQKMNALVEISAINGGTSADIVDAVNRGTAVNAHSSKTIAQATAAKNKNTTRETPSLKMWSWDKGTFAD